MSINILGSMNKFNSRSKYNYKNGNTTEKEIRVLLSIPYKKASNILTLQTFQKLYKHKTTEKIYYLTDTGKYELMKTHDNTNIFKSIKYKENENENNIIEIKQGDEKNYYFKQTMDIEYNYSKWISPKHYVLNCVYDYIYGNNIILCRETTYNDNNTHNKNNIIEMNTCKWYFLISKKCNLNNPNIINEMSKFISLFC
jgi:hypothetical protein